MCKKADIMQWSSKYSKRSLKKAIKKVKRDEQAWRSIFEHTDQVEWHYRRQQSIQIESQITIAKMINIK